MPVLLDLVITTMSLGIHTYKLLENPGILAIIRLVLERLTHTVWLAMYVAVYVNIVIKGMLCSQTHLKRNRFVYQRYC